MNNITKKILCIAVCVITASAATAFAQRDYTFRGLDPTVPTNFFSASNWQCIPPDPGCTFPGPDDTARIGRIENGGYIVFHPRALGTASVKNLFILNGSSLNFTNFTVTGMFNLADLPASVARLETLVNGGVFNNNGTMNIVSQGANSNFSGNFNFINNGTVNSWNLFLVSGPTITNQLNASFFIHATNGFGIGGNGPFAFNNFGLLSKPSSPGLAIVSPVQLTNSGTVEVGNGTLQIGGGSSAITSNCGRFSTTSLSATLVLLANVTINPCPTPAAPPGDVATNFFGPGPIRIQSNVNLNGADLRFGFAHPSSGAITAGNVELDGGSITGDGDIRIVANAQNQTKVTYLNGQILGDGDAFGIDAGGIFEILPPSFGSVEVSGRTVNNSGSILWSGGSIGNTGAANTFNNLASGLFEARSNAGLFGVTGSVFNNTGMFRKTIGTGTTNIGIRFNNTGTVEVDSGTLRFSQTAPNINTFSGNFNIAGGAFVEFASSGGGFNFNSGFSLTGAGAIRIPSGITTVNAPISISNLHLTGGTIDGTAARNMITLTGNDSLFDGGIVQRVRISYFGSGVRVQGGNTFFNDGTTLDNNGTLTAPHNTSLRQNAGAAFRLNNSGNLNPGTPLGTIFMDGIFTQSQNGIFNLEIGGTTPGTQHDQLRVFAGAASGSGIANLNGVLNVNFVNGFVPAANQFFQIMTCQNGCNGQFAQINGVNLPGDKVLIPGYGTNAVSLITTQVSGSIAPPTLQSAKTGAQNSFVFGRYVGAPSTQYLISFYRGCDGGSNNFGTKLITTNAVGLATFQANFPFPLSSGSSVSARATEAMNLTSNLSNCLQVRRGILFDRDGDGIDDIGLFRSDNNTWYNLNSSDGSFSAVRWGSQGDKIAPGDFDGDLRTDIGVYRPSNGAWYVLNSSNNTASITQFGISIDIPSAADYDGDGKSDIGVFRPSSGVWYRINSASGSIDITQFGLNGDKPVAGDYDGDAKADIAVWRPSDRVWYLLRSTQGFVATQFGLSTDYPVQSDYDGDGKTDIGVYRPSEGIWYQLRTTTGFFATQFGIAEDLPAPGDYDGDAKTDIGVFRPSNGTWYLLRSTSGFSALPFGLNGDKPIAGGFIPSIP